VKQTPDYDRGVVVGLLIAQGSFGGDGQQPQVTLKMHVRHEPVLRRLAEQFPRSRLYGPYHHGGRHFFQWMIRGHALAEDLLPLLEEAAGLDPHAAARLAQMRERYAEFFTRSRRRSPQESPGPGTP
jgi:hypothetical protein